MSASVHDFLDQVRERHLRLPPALSAALLGAAARLSEQQLQGVRPELLVVDTHGGLHLETGEIDAPLSPYAAPELREGKASPREARVLVYAVGVLGYELVTAREATLEWPLAGAELSGPFADVIRKASSPDRRKRFRSLEEMGLALQSVHERPDDDQERRLLLSLTSFFQEPQEQRPLGKLELISRKNTPTQSLQPVRAQQLGLEGAAVAGVAPPASPEARVVLEDQPERHALEARFADLAVESAADRKLLHGELQVALARLDELDQVGQRLGQALDARLGDRLAAAQLLADERAAATLAQAEARAVVQLEEVKAQLVAQASRAQALVEAADGKLTAADQLAAARLASADAKLSRADEMLGSIDLRVKAELAAAAERASATAAAFEARVGQVLETRLRAAGLESGQRPGVPPERRAREAAREVNELLADRQFAEAERVLAAALSAFPAAAVLHLRLGQLCAAQGGQRAGRAEAAFTKAAELDPSWALPKALLGQALLRRGRKAEGSFHLRSALQLDPRCLDGQERPGNEALRLRTLLAAAGVGALAALLVVLLARALATAPAQPVTSQGSPPPPAAPAAAETSPQVPDLVRAPPTPALAATPPHTAAADKPAPALAAAPPQAPGQSSRRRRGK